MTELLQLNFRRRIQALLWGRRLLWAAGIVAVLFWRTGWALFATIAIGIVLGGALKAWEMSSRRQFVREASFPRFLGAKLRATYPQLQERDTDLVLRGLRQFFMAHLRSQRKFVAMPSKVVDSLWHEYILYTRGYEAFCRKAFGRMLHHTPAEALPPSRQTGSRRAHQFAGLRRAWYWSCKEEAIDPRKPSRLPLLFALDSSLAIAGGFAYVPDCSLLGADRGTNGTATHCGTSFGCGSSCGSGDSSSSDGSGGDGSGGDGGGGDGGGGCGGGGD